MSGFFRNHPWSKPTDELIAKNNSYFQTFDTSSPFHTSSFVVFDTELTGLDGKKDEIIAIGAVRIRDFRIDLEDTFQSFIRPQNLDSTSATSIHRISTEQLEAAPSLQQVLPQFITFLHDSIIVGHYIGIDMRFLNRATKKIFSGILANPCIDTLRLTQIYNKIVLGRYQENSTSAHDSYTLQNLSAAFNLPAFAAHDAFADALQTAHLFLFLAEKMQPAGIATLDDYIKAGRGINWATL